MFVASSDSKMRCWFFLNSHVILSFYENDMRQHFLQAAYYSFAEWNLWKTRYAYSTVS